MKFQERLKKCSKEQLWREYCGFLDMSVDEYMYTQRRLMEEQLRVWSNSPLGRKLLDGKKPGSIEELRDTMPLTTYADYADVLLPRRSDMLCSEPAVWIQTTWEGGLRPIKLAPYTRGMLDCYRHNLLSVMMMATSRRKGDFDLKRGDRILYGGAPLPYATGLMPSLFDEDIEFTWLPDSNAHSDLSFSQRIKKGFSMAMSGGVDFFFGIGSVANYITESFGKGGSGGKLNISVKHALRYVRAKYISHRDGRSVVPGDIFHLKALFYAGTDARCYRDRLSAAWGTVPLELAAGTESTCLGAETWERNGMVFFPDACFYEFIPEEEMRRNRADETYQPRTCLMDEVCAGETYELVISVLHGGAFMRYRIGDTYHCLRGGKGELPRFSFVDRVPDVIDIAGFTRITASSVEEVIHLSKLGIGDWVMKKEFDAQGNPFLHMYVEITPEAQVDDVTTRQVLTEHLTVYFKYFDSDYSDLKKLLNMEPLQITILKYGTISGYEQQTGHKLYRINPGMLDITGLLKYQAQVWEDHI
ncbi:GH3 auxin-responsive promoter family protein [Oscillibacter hominis]|uniref:GH3 auxin-responsive promoter family protein n=1 Tax=Oscillibacter hominis TaxID=2763056 RepID=A0A7G9B2H1_9FIRM|nr:GH3 auxin-responsive promoter family protein [Oscillibacter hominis]QNL43752.1 GH3 auxin-responsive promoter family protein [Oscillibacter hominis]